MKSIWLSLIMLLPIPVLAQEQLQFQAQITLTDSGSWSGWSKWHPDQTYGGSEVRTLVLRFDDTISLSADSISASLRAGHLTAFFDRNANLIRRIEIKGTASNPMSQDAEIYTFTLLMDSLPLEIVGNSLLSIQKGTYFCQAQSNYSYLHPGPSGSDLTQVSGSGNGAGTANFYVPAAASVVSLLGPDTHFHITALDKRTIEIDGTPAEQNQQIEISDDVGHRVYLANFDGTSMRIANLCPGCYFARLGNSVQKVMVMP